SGKIEVLCASLALSLKSVAVNFGTQIGFFGFCVPHLLKPPKENEKFLAHKSPKLEIVCHSSQTY
ncbi:MAG: hypothetical protein IKH41_07190, partial [Clostridia bacterium]|nr:hypothetical protein [Clostridia bacterium]